MSGLAINFLVAVFAIVNPIGKIPIWVRASQDQSRGTEFWLAVLVLVTAGTILMLSLLFGTDVLEFLRIDIASFQVAGGVVIFIIGLDMLRGRAAQIDTEDEADEDTRNIEKAKFRFRKIIVPVAIPVIAGPGSITTVIIFGSRAEDWTERLVLGGMLGILLVGIFASLMAARYVRRAVGATTPDVVTRLFGLLPTAIAVHTAATGLAHLYPSLVTASSPVWDDAHNGADIESDNNSGETGNGSSPGNESASGDTDSNEAQAAEPGAMSGTSTGQSSDTSDGAATESNGENGGSTADNHSELQDDDRGSG